MHGNDFQIVKHKRRRPKSYLIKTQGECVEKSVDEIDEKLKRFVAVSILYMVKLSVVSIADVSRTLRAKSATSLLFLTCSTS